MPAQPVIVWFRDDLRLRDQPALAAAAGSGAPLLCVYVLDEESEGLRPTGGASRWWLHHSLAALAVSLERIGGRLDILRGAAAQVVPALAASSGASAVHWTRRYGAAEIAVDREARRALATLGVEGLSSNGQLLREPWTVRTAEDRPCRVFTPFLRTAKLREVPPPAPAPVRVVSARWSDRWPARAELSALELLPTKPDWAAGLRGNWTPGEAGATSRLAEFIANGLTGYAGGRDRPDLAHSSRLSPHLRSGEISPGTVLHAVLGAQARIGPTADIEKFVAEIGWREFSYHLLYHWPDLATRSLQARFESFPWRPSAEAGLAAWQRGRTGYPIVDAGMRELWATGTMHNRVRMICASFLVKDLLVDWREGERWFWDTLCDADPANNPASWQWVAGCGADAAPFFRVFNPVLQGEKFDPEGRYVCRHVPEIAALPGAWIHKPWLAPAPVLERAGVTPGVTYPTPIVEHASARKRALEALKRLKDSAAAR